MPTSWKIAKTATGSTADIKAEKTRQSVACSWYKGPLHQETLDSGGTLTEPIHPIFTRPNSDNPM